MRLRRWVRCLGPLLSEGRVQVLLRGGDGRGRLLRSRVERRCRSHCGPLFEDHPKAGEVFEDDWKSEEEAAKVKVEDDAEEAWYLSLEDIEA